MATEIERKFLVRWLPDLRGLDGRPMVQGYLRADREGTVRVRISGPDAWLTIKGPTQRNRRLEFEYAVPLEDAGEMLARLAVGDVVEKVRYRIDYRGHLWELDVFTGANAGLVLAEVELDRVDDEPPLPPWLGREVSDDARYFNASLARQPYRDWPAQPPG